MSGVQLNSGYSTSCPLCGQTAEAKLVFMRKDCPRKCDCGRKIHQISCRRCGFLEEVCFSCDFEPQRQRNSEVKSQSSTESDKLENTPYIRWMLISVLLVLFCWIIKYCLTDNSKAIETRNKELLKELRESFPSQLNETWFHFLSVLEKSDPSVKSITFLHSEDRRTPDCLINKLISLYSEDKTIKREEITFSPEEFEVRDYGFALQYCHSVVEKFRVFVTDLTTLPGEIARVFHSLCDEVSSDIKPSLFIFTVKYASISRSQKPIQGAAAVLKEIWSDLPVNEIHPLLSRVLKNVVHIIPEKESSCF